MQTKDNVSLPRKYFRRTLLVVLAISLVFFASIVTLRMNRSLHWDFVRNHNEIIFEYDVFQHQTIAYFSDLEGRHAIATKMIKNAFFSPIYGEPAIELLKENADDGFAPSQFIYGDYLTRIAYSKPEAETEAEKYFEMAAAQGYQPAKQRLQDNP